MTVFKRPSGRWAVQVWDPAKRRMRQVGTFDTRRQARSAEQAQRPSAPGRETVAAFAARWARDYPRPAAATNRHNTERVGGFVAAHGHRRLGAVDAQLARRWASQRPTTVPALRAMWGDALTEGLVAANPFARLGLRQPRGRRDLPSDWLTAADIDRLEGAAHACHGRYGAVIAAMVRFGSETGLRPGELFALDRTDLDGGRVEVRRAASSAVREIRPPKNGRPRQVVLSARAARAAELCPRLHETRVFATPTGRQLWAPAFSTLWRPVRHAAGLEPITLHHLRHYCATRLLEAGLEAWEVAVQLGHTDGGALVMSTYGHPSERRALDHVAAALGETTAAATAAAAGSAGRTG